MRWAAILVLAFSLGCSQGTSPVQPSVAPPTRPAPAAPFTISGVVRESGTNAPVEDVEVCWSNSSDPHCGRTGGDGSYAFVVPQGPDVSPSARDVQICPGASRAGFEYRQSCVPWSAGAVWSPVLQRTIQIEAGRTVTATVFPEEGSGLVMEDDCKGCKRIRITIPQTGMLVLQLIADAGAGLRLALPDPDDARSPEAPLAVTAGETVTVLVAGSVAPAGFVLSTALTTPR